MRTLLIFLILFPVCIEAQSDWNQLGQDINGLAAFDAASVTSINGDGSITAIGAPQANNFRGNVRIYKNNNGTWEQMGQILEGENAADFFGGSLSLSLSGHVLAIGASRNDGGGDASGHVRVYMYNGTSWIQQGADIDGDNAGDNSGISVSLNSAGTIVAVGADGNDDNGSNSGHVKVYQFHNNGWVQLGNNIHGQVSEFYAGRAVSLDSQGYRVAVGSPLASINAVNSGAVKIYSFDGFNWTQLGNTMNGEFGGDLAGSSVRLNLAGDIVAVGAPHNPNTNGSYAGHVRVYKFNGTAWIPHGNEIDGEAANDYSGRSIDLSADGNTIAIGAAEHNGSGDDTGQVKVYTYHVSSNSWIQKGFDIMGSTPFDNTGAGVAISKDGIYVSVGANGSDGNGESSGGIKVYQFGNPPVNNNPDGITLQVGESFEEFDIQSTTVDASSSEAIFPTLIDPDCASYSGDDVWFNVIIPSVGTLTIETRMQTDSSLTDTGIAAYTVNGTLIACNDDATGNDLFSKIELTGQTPGDTIYFRVWAYDNAEEGAFRISAYNEVLDIEDTIISDLNFYPNPTRGVVNISTAKSIKKIEIYSIMGQQVLSEICNTNAKIIDLSGFVSGVYLVTVFTETSRQTFKLIRE